jgi:uncharacterized protein YndB with AHSA1/START domain
MTSLSDKLGAISRQGETHTLTFERHYDKPVAKVWAALTVPERIADWLAEAQLDLRVEGDLRLSFPDQNYTMTGKIVALETERMIAWTWPHADHPDSVVRWELFAEGEGCRLKLTQTYLSSAHLTNVAAGWHTHLEGMPSAIDGVQSPWRAQREDEIAKLYAGLSEA